MKINPWKLSTLALGAAFALSLGSPPADSAPQAMMNKALGSLTAAKQQLDKATADKGGHRAKAITLVDQAIAEVQAGIAYDDAHKKDKPGKKRGGDTEAPAPEPAPPAEE